MLIGSVAVTAQPRILIVLRDSSGLRHGMRATVEREASRVFRAAGVEAEWTTASQSEDLVLKVLPGHESCDPLALGRAFPSHGYAQIYPETITAVALNSGWQPAELMGHIAAHEIGHLLLGSTAHSNAGIMRAYWDANTLRRLTHAALIFLPDEATAMRTATYPSRWVR